MSTKDKQRLWFCSDYGIENKAIIRRLDENNEKYYIVTHDKESKWNNITPLLQRKIMRESLKGNIIYGIGLDGTIPRANIANLDTELQENGNNISALEQATEILGIRMSLDEHFIAAYASNGITGIQRTAKKLKISENDAEKIIENIIIRNIEDKDREPTNIDIELVKYIEDEIFPLYNRNEEGHGIQHIKTVIKRSLELAKNYEVNLNMVYTIASYHDLGHYIDRKTHEIISAELFMKDNKIKQWFTDEQRIIIKEAIR